MESTIIRNAGSPNLSAESENRPRHLKYAAGKPAAKHLLLKFETYNLCFDFSGRYRMQKEVENSGNYY